MKRYRLTFQHYINDAFLLKGSEIVVPDDFVPTPFMIPLGRLREKI